MTLGKLIRIAVEAGKDMTVEVTLRAPNFGHAIKIAEAAITCDEHGLGIDFPQIDAVD